MARKTETTIVIKGDSKSAQNSIDKLSKSFDKMGGAAKKVALASGAVFAGLTGVGVLAAKSFSKFEDSMLSVKTLLDSNTFEKSGQSLAEGFEDMSKRTLKVFSRMPIDLDAATKSMFDLVSAGVDASKATKTLAVSAKLAVAGTTSVAKATDGLTSVMNAYGLSAEKADDIAGKFFLAQKFGKTTIAELSDNIGKSAASAAAMGVSFEETLSSVSAMTLGGIKTSEAFTGLNGIMAGIAIPTASAVKEAERLGIAFDLTALSTDGLTGFLKSLTENNKFTKDSVTKLFGSTEAQKAIFALTADEASKYNDVIMAVNDSTIAATTLSAAYEEQVGSLKNQTVILSNKFEALTIQVGERLAPLFEKLVSSVSAVVDWFTDLDDSTKDIIVSIGVFATAAAGVIAAMSTLVVVMPTIIAGIGLLSTAFGVLTAIMAANPIGLALVALGAVVAALGIKWGKTFKGMGDDVSGLTDTLQDEAAKMETIWEMLDRTFGSITIAGRKQVAKKLMEAVRKRDAARMATFAKLENDKTAISNAAGKARTEAEAAEQEKANATWLGRHAKFQELVLESDKSLAEHKASIEEIEGDNAALVLIRMLDEKEELQRASAERVANAWENITVTTLKDMGSAIGEGASTLWEGFVPSDLAAKISSAISAAAPAMKGISKTLGKVIKSAFKGMTSIISGLFSGGIAGQLGGVLKELDRLSTEGFGFADEVFDKFDSIVSNFISAFPGIVAKFVDMLPKLIKKIVSAIPLIIRTILKSLPSIIKVIMDAIPVIIRMIPVLVQEFLDYLPDIIEEFMKGLPEIITALLEAIPKVIIMLADALPGIIEVLADNIAPIVEALILGIMDAIPKIVFGLVDSFIMKGGLVRIIAALTKAFINIGYMMAKAFLKGLWLWVGELGQWFNAGFKSAMDKMVSWLGDFSTKQPAWLDKIFNTVRKWFTTPHWIKQFETLLRWLFDWNWPTIGGGGDQWGSTGHKYLAKGQSPSPRYLADGFSPRGMDRVPVDMIDPRERLVSASDNVSMMRALRSIQDAVSGNQKIELVFSGDGGAVEFIESLLVSANAIGTGRIDVGVGSEA